MIPLWEWRQAAPPAGALCDSKIFLHNITAHGMTDQYGRSAQAAHDLPQVSNIITGAVPANALSPFTVPMSAQAEGMDFIAMFWQSRGESFPSTRRHATRHAQRAGAWHVFSHVDILK